MLDTYFRTNNPATLSDYLGYWPWDDVGNAISQTANAVGNFVNDTVNNFMNFSNGLSESVSNLRWGSYGRPTPQPYAGATLSPSPSGPLRVPPQGWSQVNTSGPAHGNNAASGTGSPVAQNWTQRPGMFVSYWAAFLPWGKVLAPAGKLLAGVAKPGGSVAATHVPAPAIKIGGAAPVRLGQAGEAAVQAKYAIGPKVTDVVGGRKRIFDGVSSQAVSEVKNVSYQAYTQQLKDSLAYAQQNGLRFDLYVRGTTTLSRPLLDAIARREINLRFIP